LDDVEEVEEEETGEETKIKGIIFKLLQEPVVAGICLVEESNKYHSLFWAHGFYPLVHILSSVTVFMRR
jgi:hypothetical protein